MANLTSVAQLSKRLLPIFLFLFLVILFLGLIYFRQKEPTAPPITTPPQINPPTFNVEPNRKLPRLYQTANLSKIDLPQDLAVYSALKRQISRQGAEGAAAIFGFKEEIIPTEENTFDGLAFSWKADGKALTISQSTIRFEIINLQNIQGGSLSEGELLNKANSFIPRIALLNPNFYFNAIATKYYKHTSGSRNPVSSFADADSMEFQFDQKLAGLLLVGQTPAATKVRTRLSKNGEVIFFNARFFQNFIEKDQYPLKKLETAILQLKNGQGVLVGTTVFDKNNTPLPFSKVPTIINDVSLNKVELAYFLPDDLKEFIQPIYVFTGDFKQDDLRGEVIVYLQAIGS